MCASSSCPTAVLCRIIGRLRILRGIDFLAQRSNGVYAIEVKAEENLRAKSLRAFKSSHPEIKSVRFSLSGYREQDWMRNVPLYAMSNMTLWG